MTGTTIEGKEKFTPQLYQFSSLVGAKKISYLRRIIFNKKKNYNVFYIPKKRGSSRKIESPLADLKFIQRRILEKFLPYWKSSSYCHGFVKGKSIVTNSSLHTNKNIILKLDIKDFFPSINFQRVKETFISMNFNEQTARYFAELCTLDGSLPQGAPTSPALSNIICGNLDKRLFYLAKKANLNYSRYADDIVFSGDKIKRSFLKIVRKIIQEEGFVINENKIFWANKKKAQIVTGIVVNSKPSFGKKKYKNFLSLVHNCMVGDLSEQKLRASIEYNLKINDLKSYLYGMVAFIHSIDPIKSKKLKDMLDSIPKEKWINHTTGEEIINKKDLYISLLKRIRKINDRFPKPLFNGRCEDFISAIENFNNLDQFNLFCIDFGNFIDRLDTTHFGKVIDKDHQALNNLKEWLEERGYPGKDILEPIYDIKTLSNNLSRHKNFDSVSQKLKKYGENLVDPDLNKLALNLLKKVIISLDKLDSSLVKEGKLSFI